MITRDQKDAMRDGRGQAPVMNVRMKPELKKKAVQAANNDGFTSLSAWVKELIRHRIANQASTEAAGTD